MAFRSTGQPSRQWTQTPWPTGGIVYVFIYFKLALLWSLCDWQTSQSYIKGKESCWLRTNYEQGESQIILSQRQGMRRNWGRTGKALIVHNTRAVFRLKYIACMHACWNGIVLHNIPRNFSVFLPNSLVTINNYFWDICKWLQAKWENKMQTTQL